MHSIELCIHGTVTKRCRCMGPHHEIIVDCPPACKKKLPTPEVVREAVHDLLYRYDIMYHVFSVMEKNDPHDSGEKWGHPEAVHFRNIIKLLKEACPE